MKKIPQEEHPDLTKEILEPSLRRTPKYARKIVLRPAIMHDHKELHSQVIATTPVVNDALARGERAILVGFRAFQVVGSKARSGRNLGDGTRYPKTNKKV